MTDINYIIAMVENAIVDCKVKYLDYLTIPDQMQFSNILCHKIVDSFRLKKNGDDHYDHACVIRISQPADDIVKYTLKNFFKVLEEKLKTLESSFRCFQYNINTEIDYAINFSIYWDHNSVGA